MVPTVGPLGPTAQAMVHRIIGCDWGRLIALPNNREPCCAQAATRTVLHDPHGGQLMVQLCAEHHHILLEQTDPHAGSGAAQ